MKVKGLERFDEKTTKVQLEGKLNDSVFQSMAILYVTPTDYVAALRIGDEADLYILLNVTA